MKIYIYLYINVIPRFQIKYIVDNNIANIVLALYLEIKYVVFAITAIIAVKEMHLTPFNVITL